MSDTKHEVIEQQHGLCDCCEETIEDVDKAIMDTWEHVPGVKVTTYDNVTGEVIPTPTAWVLCWDCALDNGLVPPKDVPPLEWCTSSELHAQAGPCGCWVQVRKFKPDMVGLKNQGDDLIDSVEVYESLVQAMGGES